MSTEFGVDFMWVPADLGGHRTGPYDGMRISIRWQRAVHASAEITRDVECRLIRYDEAASRGLASCRLTWSEPISQEWLEAGQLVELLNGFRVVAIGRVPLDGKGL